MQNFIEVGSHRIDYTVVRSNRKTIGISLSLQNGVKVSAPYRVSEKQIAEVIIKKARWIINKLSHLENIKSEVPHMKFVDGEKFLLLGEKYKLKVNYCMQANLVSISISDRCLVVSLPQGIQKNAEGNIAAFIQNYLAKWYKDRAKEIVSERIKYFSKQLGVTPAKIIIKDLKSIWGSCTGKNTININWRIIMAPLDIVDYLVVHELAHIKVKNHSKDFWKVTESIFPNYRECSKWLKKNGHKLNI